MFEVLGGLCCFGLAIGFVVLVAIVSFAGGQEVMKNHF